MENKQEFEEINPDTWKPVKDGDQVEGVLVNKRTGVGVNESNAYDLANMGTQIMVWGSAVLDNRMDSIAIGDFVRITYQGTKLNAKGQDTKIFKVEKAKDRSVVTEEKVQVEDAAASS